ncbi:MBL fold metallo-hydrolase [Siphonobacter sp. BAB-5385]|uniref:MBL fold metallo-hydrolase n=1 Tax=Siphonobacter sp. BAB-5385 TaxID=1864822 RepID=UPI000B9E9038|nr:MBL fold metallo-hydrolase [Siphonobacter sp. BAB-5385]OZI07335.1 MBL fold metallo-hydrolase [Siphonobacter sp. BAB-5385]
MSLFITSLNSGSNGNCYYVGNGQDAVLIDVGISCRQIESRLRRLSLSVHTIKAIFISHEHTDHISGTTNFARKYQLPVYLTPKTLRSARLLGEGLAIRFLSGTDPVWVGDLCVKAFPKFHDAADPHSFMVSYEGTRVGVFTDLGQTCTGLIEHFSQCHAAFLEANYDEAMLEQGRYPYFLKQRIRGGHGHLSNQQALDLLRTHKPAYMSHVILSHLSKENNCPIRARELFLPHMDTTELVVASRLQETPVYHIKAREVEQPVVS